MESASVAAPTVHDDHHHGRAGHDARGLLDAERDRVVGAHPAVDRLADPAQDEHVVVHREAEQDHEQQDRDDRVDPVGGVEPSTEALCAARDLLIAEPEATAAVEVLTGRAVPEAAVPAIR